MPARRSAQGALIDRARGGAGLLLAMFLLVALLLVACDGSDDGAGTTPTPGISADGPEPGTPTPRPITEGDGPAIAEREIGVLTVTTGIDEPYRVAVAAGGDRVVLTSNGRMLHDDGETITSLGRLTEGAAVRGFAVDPGFPDPPHVFVLLERDGQVEVHRLVMDGATLQSDEVLATAEARQSYWPGNGLAFAAGGTLYAALGDPADALVALDAEALIAGEHSDAVTPPCNPSMPAGPADLGPWVAVGAEATGAPEGLPLWSIEGVVAIAVYQGESIRHWHGSLLLVTGDGDLLRTPAGEDGCIDLERTEVLYEGQYGALADVAMGADGDLYLATANGAGGDHPDDDRLLRVAAVEDLGLLYPDLRTRPPASLGFDTGQVESGETERVLRFTNTVMNLGQGPLEIRSYGGEQAVQRIYTDEGSYLEREAGLLTEHWSHAHFHFEDLNRFELWDREAYERMLDGDEDAEPRWVEEKVSMCLMDLVPVTDDPHPAAYASQCVQGAQGISVGWGDVYFFDISEQWVVLDGALADGDYVIRSIVDAEHLFHESPGGRDESRESHEANGAAVWFTLSNGEITVTDRESGAGEAWAE